MCQNAAFYLVMFAEILVALRGYQVLQVHEHVKEEEILAMQLFMAQVV